MDIAALLDEHRGPVFLGICVLAAALFFRRQTAPIFLSIISFFLYLVPAHFLLLGGVRLTAWFKDASSMKHAFDATGESYDPGWTVPIYRIWDKTEFTPEGLYYFELLMVVAAVVLVWKYQPLRAYDRKKPLPARKYPQGYTSHRMAGKK